MKQHNQRQTSGVCSDRFWLDFGRRVFFDKNPAPFTTPEQPIDVTQKLRELVKSAYLEGSRVQEFYGAADWEKSHAKEILDSLEGGE